MRPAGNGLALVLNLPGASLLAISFADMGEVCIETRQQGVAQEYDVIVTQGLSGMAVADYAARANRPVARFIAGVLGLPRIHICFPSHGPGAPTLSYLWIGEGCSRGHELLADVSPTMGGRK